MIGKGPPKMPSFAIESLWQTPHACTFTTTSPRPASGRSRSTSRKSLPAAAACIARILAILDPPFRLQGQDGVPGHFRELSHGS
jgi:hypothetical protein